MIHYAGVTAYNEVQSDTPVAVDNGGSGGTGLTTFLERRVVVAIREVTRRDLHEGGPASRQGTDRIFRGRRSPCGPSVRPNHRHILRERNAFPYGRPRGCAHTLPSGMRSGLCPVGTPLPLLLRGRERGTAPPVPPAATRWKSMNACSARRDRLASGALLLVGKGGEKKGSPRTPAHVLASGGAARRCRSGGKGAGLAVSAAGRSRTPGRRANLTAGQLGGTPRPRAMRLMKAQRQWGWAKGQSPLCHIPLDRAGPGRNLPHTGEGGVGIKSFGPGGDQPFSLSPSPPGPPHERAAFGNGRAPGGACQGTRDVDASPRPREERCQGPPRRCHGA